MFRKFINAAFAASALSISLWATDPMVGTWLLNTGRSKFESGSGPQKQTIKVEDTAGSLHTMLEMITAEGNAVTAGYTIRKDGKDHPVTLQTADTANWKRIDERTTDMVFKKDGKEVSRVKVVISPDGKTQTVTGYLVDSKGKKEKILAVYEKQMVSTGVAQKPEYEFYDQFRRWSYDLLVRDRGGLDEVLKRYDDKLRAEGITSTEIDRRINLIRNARPKLEADWWNHSLTADNPKFNTAPNALLVEVVKDLKPGTALDVGIGEGRNAIYLAQRGWTVTGFDIADRALELVRKRASQIGKSINTVVSTSDEWKYEENKWDLIVYSWVLPPVHRSAEVIRSLRPNGLILFEGRGEWVPEDRLQSAFASLRSLRHERRHRTDTDFFRGTGIPVVQFVAQKPE